MTDGGRPDARYWIAARGYFVYGLVYYVGGLYLLSQGVGVRGAMEGRRTSTLAFWALAGLVPLLGVPYLLHARRAWFERWIFSRRDFARVVAVFLAFRSWKVAQVVLQHHGTSALAPWGGTVTFQAGAAVFLIVTVAALAAVTRAAWMVERSEAPERAGGSERAGGPERAGVSPGARDSK